MSAAGHIDPFNKKVALQGMMNEFAT